MYRNPFPNSMICKTKLSKTFHFKIGSKACAHFDLQMLSANLTVFTYAQKQNHSRYRYGVLGCRVTQRAINIGTSAD